MKIEPCHLGDATEFKAGGESASAHGAPRR